MIIIMIKLKKFAKNKHNYLHQSNRNQILSS